MSDEQNTGQSNPLEEQLEAEKKRSVELLTRLKYLQADFENLKKRCDRQIAEAKNYGTERLILELLEVADELELALKTAQSTESAKLLIEGVQMTLKKLRKVLEQEGVFSIDCEGKTFDPSRHSSINTIERDDVDGCVVAEEARKGYVMKDKVLRPSVVKVAVKASKSQKERKENE